MDADELAKAVRRGEEKLRADNLVLDTGTKKLTGTGYLIVQSDRLNIRMTLDAGIDPSSSEGPNVATKSDFWTLTGILDHNLAFHCNFGPGSNMSYHNGIWTLEESVNPLKLEGLQRLSAEERKARWKEIQFSLYILNEDNRSEAAEADAEASFEAAEATRLADGSFEFHADFVDHKLRFKNEKTHIQRKNPFLGEEGSGWKTNTLMGESSTYRFAFVQEDDSDDLRLVMRSKEDQPPLSEESQMRKYKTLVQALSFVHGINVWPYRLQYWRAGEKWEDELFAVRPAPRTAHSPFSGLRHEVNMGEFLPKVAEFLEPATPFNNELLTLMYLFRQSGAKGVHRKVGSLTLCALLESLTRLLFNEFGLKEPSTGGRFGDFDARKTELLNFLKGLTNPNESVLRLRDVVSSAQATKKLKVEEKFEMVCQHLSLQWDGKMKVVKEAWEQLRNPLAHGDFREGESITEQVFKDDTVAESRIAGGFNTILLKLFGYSGPYNPSVFESGYSKM